MLTIYSTSDSQNSLYFLELTLPHFRKVCAVLSKFLQVGQYLHCTINKDRGVGRARERVT